MTPTPPAPAPRPPRGSCTAPLGGTGKRGEERVGHRGPGTLPGTREGGEGQVELAAGNSLAGKLKADVSSGGWPVLCC